MNRIDLYRIIADVQHDHTERLTVADHVPMQPRGRREKLRPNTALISEYAKRWEEKRKRLIKRKRSAA